jgi:NADPH:quinone reductase-like Zn-dependent oxidoreductase
MNAVVHDRYGPPDVLRHAEVGRPVPRGDEILVRVRATTVDRADCGLRAASPFIVRFFSGLLRPKRTILGSELAGEVEAVGAAVQEFAVGDEVFGVNDASRGAHAEFVCVPVDAAGKPSFRRCRRALAPGGTSFATDLGFLAQNPALVLATRWTGGTRVQLPLPRYRKESVFFVEELIGAGEYRAVIEGVCPLEQVVEATRYVETGQKTGNVVLTVSPNMVRER